MAHTWIFIPFALTSASTRFSRHGTPVWKSGEGKKEKESVTAYCWYHVTARRESRQPKHQQQRQAHGSLIYFLMFFLLFHDDENVLLATVRRSSIENYSVLPFSVDTYIRGCNYLRARSHIWHTTLVKLPPFFLSMAIRRYNLLFDGVPTLRVFFISHANGHLKSVKHSLSSANAFWDLYGSV